MFFTNSGYILNLSFNSVKGYLRYANNVNSHISQERNNRAVSIIVNAVIPLINASFKWLSNVTLTCDLTQTWPIDTNRWYLRPL